MQRLAGGRDGFAIPVARRLRNHQKRDVRRALIDRCVREARLDLQPDSLREHVVRALDLQNKLAVQDEEELARVRMPMALLARAGRHALLDDAQARAANEVPAVAPARPPGVVRRRRR